MAIADAITDITTNPRDWKQAITSLGKRINDELIKSLVGKPIEDWLKAQATALTKILFPTLTLPATGAPTPKPTEGSVQAATNVATNAADTLDAERGTELIAAAAKSSSETTIAAASMQTSSATFESATVQFAAAVQQFATAVALPQSSLQSTTIPMSDGGTPPIGSSLGLNTGTLTGDVAAGDTQDSFMRDATATFRELDADLSHALATGGSLLSRRADGTGAITGGGVIGSSIGVNPDILTGDTAGLQQLADRDPEAADAPMNRPGFSGNPDTTPGAIIPLGGSADALDKEFGQQLIQATQQSIAPIQETAITSLESVSKETSGIIGDIFNLTSSAIHGQESFAQTAINTLVKLITQSLSAFFSTGATTSGATSGGGGGGGLFGSLFGLFGGGAEAAGGGAISSVSGLGAGIDPFAAGIGGGLGGFGAAGAGLGAEAAASGGFLESILPLIALAHSGGAISDIVTRSPHRFHAGGEISHADINDNSATAVPTFHFGGDIKLPRFHFGAAISNQNQLSPGDVIIIAKQHEFVINDKSVAKVGKPVLEFINQYGRLPDSRGGDSFGPGLQFDGSGINQGVDAGIASAENTLSISEAPSDSFTMHRGGDILPRYHFGGSVGGPEFMANNVDMNQMNTNFATSMNAMSNASMNDMSMSSEGPVTVNFSVNNPQDADSFRRSRPQIMSDLGRTVKRAMKYT